MLVFCWEWQSTVSCLFVNITCSQWCWSLV